MLREKVTAHLQELKDLPIWSKVEPRLEQLAQRKLPAPLERLKKRVMVRLKALQNSSTEVAKSLDVQA